jgi:dihydrofolate reductase
MAMQTHFAEAMMRWEALKTVRWNAPFGLLQPPFLRYTKLHRLSGGKRRTFQMGKITVVNNITLDGVMQAPARPDEDPLGGFALSGWGIPYQDGVIAQKMGAMMASGEGSLLLGRRTYEDFYSVWPKRTDNPFTEHLNKVQKYVASRSLKEPLPWQNSTLLKGDAVAALKGQEDQSFAILGSGELIQSLIRRNLIDEYMLLIFPIVLGTGRRLFPDEETVRLRLVESLTATTGVIIATYQVA